MVKTAKITLMLSKVSSILISSMEMGSFIIRKYSVIKVLNYVKDNNIKTIVIK